MEAKIFTRKSISILLAVPMLLAGVVSFADTDSYPNPRDMAGSPTPLNADWLKVEGSANLDFYGGKLKDSKDNIRSIDNQIRLEAKLAESVKAVVLGELDRQIEQSGVDVSTQQSMKSAIRNAYIEIQLDKMTGLPVALIVGKQTAAFGQFFSRLPMFEDNLTYDLARQDRVTGITMVLNKNFFSLFDKAAITYMATQPDSWKLGKDSSGVSVKLSKSFTPSLQAEISAMSQDTQDSLGNVSGHDKRASIGAVYDDGTWKIYGEGLRLEGNLSHPDAKWAGNAGIAHAFGPGEVVVETSYIDGSAKQIQIGVAYNLAVGDYVTVSPEFRHNKNYNGISDENRYGLRLNVKTSKTPAQKEN